MKRNLLVISFISSFLFACSSPQESGTTKPTASDSLQTTVIYECPMKCEGKTYEKSGTCSVCGMELVVKN